MLFRRPQEQEEGGDGVGVGGSEGHFLLILENQEVLFVPAQMFNVKINLLLRVQK